MIAEMGSLSPLPSIKSIIIFYWIGYADA
jgi:hypothetical protein